MDQNLRDASFIASDSRSNFKSVIAKRSDLVKFIGGRMKAPATSTVYEAGTVLGQITAAGPNQYKFAPYAAGNTDGSEVPVCILSESTQVDPNGEGSKVIGIIKGSVFSNMLIGMDANAITLMGAKAYVEGSVSILEI